MCAVVYKIYQYGRYKLTRGRKVIVFDFSKYNCTITMLTDYQYLSASMCNRSIYKDELESFTEYTVLNFAEMELQTDCILAPLLAHISTLHWHLKILNNTIY